MSSSAAPPPALSHPPHSTHVYKLIRYEGEGDIDFGYFQELVNEALAEGATCIGGVSISTLRQQSHEHKHAWVITQAVLYPRKAH